MREIGMDPALLDVDVAVDGTVNVEDEPIGRIDGFRFTVDSQARVGDRKRLLAAAERRLPKERARRAEALAKCPDADLALVGTAITWTGHEVARLEPGRDLIHPRIVPDAALGSLHPADREKICARIETWLTDLLRRHLAPLKAMARTANDLFTPPSVRALLAPLAASGGCIARAEIEPQLAALDPGDRRILRAAGLTVGSLDLYDARLLKPEALRWIAVLGAVRAKSPVPVLPPPGATVSNVTGIVPGFRAFGGKQVRVDIVERIARALHDKRSGDAPLVPDPSTATAFGVDAPTFDAILRALGFRADGQGGWRWRARPRAAPKPVARGSGHFAELGSLVRLG